MPIVSVGNIKIFTIMCLVLLLLGGVSLFIGTTALPERTDSACTTRSVRCILPQHPGNGSYEVISEPSGEPDDALDSAVLSVTCVQGYSRSGKAIVHCVNGQWSNTMPVCVPVEPAEPEEPETLRSSPSDSSCVLPPQPEHGRYDSSEPDGTPGQRFESLLLNFTCDQGYAMDGTDLIYCFMNTWSDNPPKCMRVIPSDMCRVDFHPSIEYRCMINGSMDTRACNEQEPEGTAVIPTCRTPNNFTTAIPLAPMHCRNGGWDYVVNCIPECGTVHEGSRPGRGSLDGLGIGGTFGELPWHAGIYTKTTNPYRQICGGSIISNNIVITAAHCLWDGFNKKHFPSANYAVGVGKSYRLWDSRKDKAQKSDVKDIKIPVRYQGNVASFQDDIALMILFTPFVYGNYVTPVCISFDIHFVKQQLQQGKIGKVAGWGLTEENGAASQKLMLFNLPYVSVEQCLADYPLDFRRYVTSDKICAGYTNGTALCKGDSGGGLAFPVPYEKVRGSKKTANRYYLQGIASTAPTSQNLCNAFTYTTFTHLLQHEHFLRDVWTELPYMNNNV